MEESNQAIIRIQNLWTQFGDYVVHQDLNLEIQAGEIVSLVGGSGSGKTTLLRQMLGLEHPTRGTVSVFGEDVQKADPIQLQRLRRPQRQYLADALVADIRNEQIAGGVRHDVVWIDQFGRGGRAAVATVRDSANESASGHGLDDAIEEHFADAVIVIIRDKNVAEGIRSHAGR